METLSAADARALALAASLPATARPDALGVLGHLGLLQLDPLSRVEKAHRLTCVIRTGPSLTLAQIDRSLWSEADGSARASAHKADGNASTSAHKAGGNASASTFEAWVHAVCLVPIEHWPLLRLFREAAKSSPKRPAAAELDQVLAIVAEHPDGATMSEIEEEGPGTRGWDWSQRKHATEHMLRSGELVCTARRGSKRVFDLPERRVPCALLRARLDREQILAALATSALRAMGVATARDVAVYYNLSAASALAALRASGAEPVQVEGWAQPAWVAAGQPPPPASSRGPLLIGPFDNLIWDRDRTRRLFGFDYAFEAYKPAAKRVYGYYVLAVLEDGQFLGRADLCRNSDGLTIIHAVAEQGVDCARSTTR
ncbi:MAG TPA: crosslink repair DNA glycosylase YcaQ family protein [Trebonia sp.]|nr:crosslink repair DNA glycosylase YcaQ family protein [Trebonia sp.]